jgi:hypothetical protein
LERKQQVINMDSDNIIALVKSAQMQANKTGQEYCIICDYGELKVIETEVLGSYRRAELIESFFPTFQAVTFATSGRQSYQAREVA